jgi:dTDP-4-dehydrorhamnose reductase
MRILVFGHKGQLGSDLMRYAGQKGIDVYGVDLPECDITVMDSINQSFAAAGDVILALNAAAYTDVDQAENNSEAAFAVNRDGVANIAQACRQRKIPLIHLSTDYVFNGCKTRPYTPDDPINPNGVYAQSKAAGEDAVRKWLERHLIIRVSWLVGRYGNNFVKTMLRLGKTRDEIRVVDDQVGSPTFTADVAQALFHVAAKINSGFSHWGTYHYCNDGALTWYAFARKIIGLAKVYENLVVKDIVSILTENYPTPAPRPQYSVLDCSSFVETFGICPRPWDAALKEMLADLYTS